MNNQWFQLATIMNQALRSLHGGSLEIEFTVPLMLTFTYTVDIYIS